MKKLLIREAVDQSAHFLAAALVVFAVHPATWWQSAILGFALGAVREVTEGGNVVSDGSIRDLVFWTLGGLSMGLILA